MTIADDIIAFMQERPFAEYAATDIADDFIKNMEVHKKKNPLNFHATITTTIKNKIRDENLAPQLKDMPGSSKPKTYYWDNGNPDLDENFEPIIKPRPEGSGKKPRKSKQRGTKRRQGKNEKGLYDPLVKYLRKEMRIYAKRIEEKKVLKRGGKGRNKWRHPDVVGVQGSISDKDLHHSVQSIAKLTIDKAKLFAFEVKEEVTGSSLRGDFHQTVASTIWANYGFLCAEKFDTDDETEHELKQLNNAYGIGLILINRKNPEDSYIHTKARETRVDLEICSTLAKNNEDFANFITRAVNVYETGIVEIY